MLDAGCGTGFLLERLLDRGLECIGLDISEGMLSVARARLAEKVGLVQGDVRNIPFRSQAFDLVICSRVVSHIKNAASALIELERVAAPGAAIVITDLDPAHNYDFTKIPIKNRNLKVETFKHSPQMLISEAEHLGLHRVREEYIGGPALNWMPPSNVLTSIDRSGMRGVGFMLVFRKHGRLQADVDKLKKEAFTTEKADGMDQRP